MSQKQESSEEVEDDLGLAEVLEVYNSDEVNERKSDSRLIKAIKAHIPGPGMSWVYICQIVDDKYKPNFEYSTQADKDTQFRGSLLKIGFTSRTAGPIERLVELIQSTGHSRLIALMVNTITQDEQMALTWMKSACSSEDKAIFKGKKKKNTEYFVYDATNVRRACFALWTARLNALKNAELGTRSAKEDDLPKIYYCSNPTRMNSTLWFDGRSRIKKNSNAELNQAPIKYFKVKFRMGQNLPNHPKRTATVSKKQQWLMSNLRAGRYVFAHYYVQQTEEEIKNGAERKTEKFQGIITGISNFTETFFELTAIWDAEEDNPINNLSSYKLFYEWFGDTYFLKDAVAGEEEKNLQFDNRDATGALRRRPAAGQSSKKAAANPSSAAGPSSATGPSSKQATANPLRRIVPPPASSSRPTAGPPSAAGQSSKQATANPLRRIPPLPASSSRPTAGPSSGVAGSKKRPRPASSGQQRVLGKCYYCESFVTVGDANAHLLVTTKGPVFENDIDPERAKGLKWAHKRCATRRKIKEGEPGYNANFATNAQCYTHCLYCNELVYTFTNRISFFYDPPRGENKNITQVILHRGCRDFLNAKGNSVNGADYWVQKQFKPSKGKEPASKKPKIGISSLHRLFHSHVNI